MTFSRDVIGFRAHSWVSVRYASLFAIKWLEFEGLSFCKNVM